MPANLAMRFDVNDEMRRFLTMAGPMAQTLIPNLLNEMAEWILGRRVYAGANPMRNYVTKHFGPGAGMEYGYARHKMPYARLRAPTPFLFQSGNLMRGVLNSEKIPSGNSVTLETITPIYAAIIAEGGVIEIPEIRPVNARRLRWHTKGMVVVFRMKAKAHLVRMPKRDFWRPSAQDERWAGLAAEEAFMKLLTGITSKVTA